MSNCLISFRHQKIMVNRHHYLSSLLGVLLEVGNDC